jgi:hypothetical protein
MAVNETIVTNRYFRRCTDAANKVWQRISFWHKASDCEFDDGSTAQTKVGAIKGITTSTSVTETGYAADMTTVKGLQTQIDELNSNLSGKSLKIVHFETGGSGNYKTANIIFDVSNFSTLHFDGTGGIGSGGFAVLGGSGVNIPYGIRQCSLTNSVTLESIGDGGSSKKEYDISKYSYIRLYMRGTPEGYDYIKYFSNISFS